MALPTALVSVQPPTPWSKAYRLRAPVSVATTGRDSVHFFVRAAAKGLGVVAGFSAPGVIRASPAAAAAGHDLVGLLGVAAGSGGRLERGAGATAAAPAGLGLGGPTPAHLLTVACAGGRSDPMNTGGEDDEDMEMSLYQYLYWESVRKFEEEFRPAALFGDKELTGTFVETAERGVAVINKTVNTTKELNPHSPELQDLITASKSLRRVSIQGNKGYVLASSVVEASNAVYKVMSLLSPDRAVPPYASVVPYVVHEEEIGDYFRKVLVGFRALICEAEKN